MAGDDFDIEMLADLIADSPMDDSEGFFAECMPWCGK